MDFKGLDLYTTDELIEELEKRFDAFILHGVMMNSEKL